MKSRSYLDTPKDPNRRRLVATAQMAHTMDCSRRSLLQWAGAVAGLATTAGCIDIGSGSDYTLVSSDFDRSLGAEYLVPEPVELPASTRVDYTDERKQQYLDELFERGRVTAVQWPLVRRQSWGTETQPRPTFVQHEGTYYEIQVAEARRYDRERWVFACKRIDETAPDDATVATAPFDSLSEQDRNVVDAALDAVYAGHDGFLGDPEFDELQTVQFHEGLSAEESDLVPTPPFEYIESERETFRVVTEQRTVSVPEWTYTLERVGDSREELDAYASDTVPKTRLADLSESARNVLDAAVSEEDRPTYEEDSPLSEGLTEVLEALGIADDLQSLDAYEERTAFRGTVASYEGVWYRFDLLVEP